MLKKKKGFTLIEIVVSLALFSIVALAITSILVNVVNTTNLNRQTYNADSASKVIFESLRENRPTKLNNPASLDGSFKGEASTGAEIREFVSQQILKKIGRVSVAEPADFTQCKSTNDKEFSFGVKVLWDNSQGLYEVETWVWQTYKGESTMINRKTYLTPR